MKNYFNVAVANGINKLGWTPDVPDEHLGMKFSPTCHEVITICEEIEKRVESWPLIKGVMPGEEFWPGRTTDSGEHTFQARLAFIEEIKKECPKHEPDVLRAMDCYVYSTRCKHCRVELQATWTEKGER